MIADLSQSGFMGDMTGTELIIGVNTDITAPQPVNDCVGGGINNATFPNDLSAHFRLLWGYQQGQGQEIECLNQVIDNTDVIQIKRLLGPATNEPISKRYYMATTATQAEIYTTQDVSSLLNARTWEYQHHIYYLRKAANQVPSLHRKVLTFNSNNDSGNMSDQQLVEGIENIQVLYGFDNDGDGSANVFMPSQNITDLMWDNQLSQRLVALRIFILIRSIERDPNYFNSVVYKLGDVELQPFNDNYRRKIMASTIMLENPGIINN